MKCPLCKGTMERGETTLPFELGADRVVVVKHVPALTCQQCGDYFVELDVTKRVEKFVAVATKDGLTLGFLDYQQAA
ncbi:MAG: type II toxin-antitoxin system MqsA family antitoxin [Deltaproteobacteria bacterium]|nr:type II toxin-antitoxin system MqsA family antitoxin [Deltaproteobacteria bacterium]